jgi:hypothetical protein
MKMKTLYATLFVVVCLAWLGGCQPKQTENDTAKQASHAEKFNAFVALFPDETKTLPATFGEEWLDRQISPVKIDSTNSTLFIHKNLVHNHQLLINGADEKETELGQGKNYYIISKIPLNAAFVSLIVSDLEKDGTDTYLLNYTPEGVYVSGILLQCRHWLKEGEKSTKVTRESVVSDSQMILCQEKLVGRNKFVNYDVATNGKIVLRN